MALPKLSTAADLQVQQSTFTQAGYQQWMIRPVGGGVYSICNWGSSISGSMCLAVKGASTAAGAAVVQQSYAPSVPVRGCFQGVPDTSTAPGVPAGGPRVPAGCAGARRCRCQALLARFQTRSAPVPGTFVRW